MNECLRASERASERANLSQCARARVLRSTSANERLTSELAIAALCAIVFKRLRADANETVCQIGDNVCLCASVCARDYENAAAPAAAPATAATNDDDDDEDD